MTPNSSRTRFIVSMALAGVAMLGWPDPSTRASATAASTAIVVAPVDVPADAARPAQRLRLGDGPIFPMQTTPRCDILDNFGDPRSGGRTHQGVDILATLGQEIYAATDGTLTLQVLAGSSGPGASLSGNLWTLTAPNGSYSVYAHLSGFAAGLSIGSAVSRGQLIGYVGDTGNAGPGNYHLHFEWHPGGGAALNPLAVVVIPRECAVYSP